MTSRPTVPPDPKSPIYSPQQSCPAFIGNNPKAPPINVGTGDMVYAVAFAADSNGSSPGSNTLSRGPDFTAEFPVIANPLVEDGGTGNPVTAQATVAGNANPRAFIFALGILIKTQAFFFLRFGSATFRI